MSTYAILTDLKQLYMQISEPFKKLAQHVFRNFKVFLSK